MNPDKGYTVRVLPKRVWHVKLTAPIQKCRKDPLPDLAALKMNYQLGRL